MSDMQNRYQQASDEVKWYQQRLLRLSEQGGRGSDEWDELYEQMKDAGNRKMKLARKV